MLHSNAHRTWLPWLAALGMIAPGCAGQPESGDSTSHLVTPLSADCTGVPVWAAGTAYATGALVQHDGEEYRCLQGHKAQSDWSPEIVPALWQDTAACEKDGGDDSSSSSSDDSTSSGGDCGSGSGGDSGTGGASPSSSSTGSGESSSSGGSSDGGGTDYAPYFYTWGWGNAAYAFTSLQDLQAKSGLGGVTLAFVLSDGGCSATRDIQDHQGDIDAFRAGGGRIKASFGGANGTYLENACGDAGSMADALVAFVDETGIKDLDFDVEQWGAMTSDVNARRAQALKSAQESAGIQVAFTLACYPRDKWGTPGGMSAASLDVVKAAVFAGVQISHVNLMTMDYGGYYSDGKAMGDLAISALTDANAQLRSIIPGLGEEEAWGMLGATPMIGQNDVGSEVFTLADAQSLTSFAKEKHLGLVAFWAIHRDQPGAGSLGLYSGVNPAPFSFHQIFQGVLP